MIRAAPWLAALVLLTASCGPRRTQWRPREVPEAQRTSSFAVVWAGARFRIAPRPGAAIVSLAPVSDSRQPWARDTFISFRVISERAGWATLETVGEEQTGLCTPDRPALSALRLRVHVMSRALVRVTVREISQPFQDGTRLELARGVPLEPLGQGDLYRTRLGALSTLVRLEASAVGTRFLPSDSVPDLGSAAGRLMSGALRAGVPVIGRTGRVHSAERDDVPVWGVEPHGAEALIDLRPRCARLRARVLAHLVGPPSESSAGAPTEPAPTEPGPIEPTYVDADAPIFWPGGADAGVVATRIAVRSETGGDAALRCFEHSLHLGSPPSTVLCFRSQDVVDP